MENQTQNLPCALADTQLRDFLVSSPIQTSHHRVESQKNKCNFGLSGTCCRLCSNGPCRITPSSPLGVCGASADVIVSRNFLRSVAAGCASYLHLAENAAKKLKKLARMKKSVPGTVALDRAANLFGIREEDPARKALAVAEAVLEDLNNPSEEAVRLLDKMALPARVAVWEKLGILPGGAKSEVLDAVVKTGTNLNSDPTAMLLDSLKLGIVTGFYGLMMSCLLNDILIGEPQIQTVPVGLGVMDPAAINVLVIGHQPACFEEIRESFANPETLRQVNEAGASEIRLVGCTCAGQEMQQRCFHMGSGYCGHAGNNFASELIVATGCIDLVVSEFNCNLPGLDAICQQFHVPQICLDDVAKTENAQLIPYQAEQAKEIAQKVVEKAIDSYRQNRADAKMEIFEKEFAKGNERLGGYLQDAQTRQVIKSILLSMGKDFEAPRRNPLQGHGNKTTMVGFSEKTLVSFLGGTYEPLLNLIVSGDIQGLAGVLGCSNLQTMGHDVMIVELTKQLIKRDILVLSAGCTSGALENVGLMSPQAAQLAGPKLQKICMQLGIPPVLNFGSCLGIGRLEVIAGEIAATLHVDIPQLPLVVSAPQWLEEQALADGAFALSLGLSLHLGSAPFVTGSPLAVEVLTEQMTALTGGSLMIEADPAKAADWMENTILDKRKGLSL